MDINVKHFSEFLANNIEMPTVCIPSNSEGKTKQEQWEMFITAWNKLDKKNEAESGKYKMPVFVVKYEDGTEERYSPEELGMLFIKGLIKILEEIETRDNE